MLSHQVWMHAVPLYSYNIHRKSFTQEWSIWHTCIYMHCYTDLHLCRSICVLSGKINVVTLTQKFTV